jgi:hypothetical protein
MDARFNGEPLTHQDRLTRVVAGLLALPLLWLVASVPLGLYRSSRDAYWCKAFGHHGEQCVKERRAERWGPFNAWGDNGRAGD